MLGITAVAGIASLAQTLGSFVALSSQEMRKEADGHGNRRFGRSGLWFSGVLGSHQFSDAAGHLFPRITVTRTVEVTEWATQLWQILLVAYSISILLFVSNKNKSKHLYNACYVLETIQTLYSY